MTAPTPAPRDLPGMSDDEFAAIVLKAREIQGAIVAAGGMATKSKVEDELMPLYNLTRGAAHQVLNFIEAHNLYPIRPTPPQSA